MSDGTNIEWTDATWNPLRLGAHRWYCEKISPGCDNCYASTFNRRLGGNVYPLVQATREPDTLPVLDEKALKTPLGWKKPRRIFVCSMTDLFGEWVSDADLDRIFAVMAATPHHTYQVLTKRPQRMAKYLTHLASQITLYIDRTGDLPGIHESVRCRAETGLRCWPLPNVWTGVTVESDRYTWRADYLRKTPAAVRWISAEPLISGLPSLDLADIDWIVTGGESGHGARPFNPSWALDIRDRCRETGTAFFHKQHGGRTPKANGRLLDGQEYSEYPEGADVSYV